MWQVILSVLLIIVGGLLSFFEKYTDNNAENKSNKFNYLSLALVVIGASVALWTGCNAVEDNLESKHQVDSVNSVLASKQDTIKSKQDTIRSMSAIISNKQDSLVKLQSMNFDTAKRILEQSIWLNRAQYASNFKQTHLINLQSKSFDTARAILSKSLELNEMQKENNLEQKKLLNQITGGGNKPRLAYQAAKIQPEDTTYNVVFYLINDGSFPISDVFMEVQEVYQIAALETVSSDKITGRTTLPPNGSRLMYTSRPRFMKVGTYYQYDIEVRWSRSAYYATIQLYPTEGNPPTFKFDVKYMLENGIQMPDDYFKIKN